MSSIFEKLKDIPLLYPDFVAKSSHYEVIMGSFAYGVSNDTSDLDVYGFCIPPKEDLFPHLKGEIIGFGHQSKRFEQYQKVGVVKDQKEYDITMYTITKYFKLCMDNNPNMIDSLFVPENCVIHSTKIGDIVRENRKLFLHKGSWHKFKGYSYSQITKMQSQLRVGKRKETVDKYGYDIKFAYHCVRLMNEVEQILIEQDLDLQRNREQLKSIRKGEWTQDEILNYFKEKEFFLEKAYAESKLREKPAEDEIKQLLLNCLEEEYGSLDQLIVVKDKNQKALNEIKAVIERYKI